MKLAQLSLIALFLLPSPVMAISYQEALEQCYAERGYSPPKVSQETECTNLGNGRFRCKHDDTRRGFTPESELICKHKAAAVVRDGEVTKTTSPNVNFETKAEKKAFKEAASSAQGTKINWTDTATSLSGSIEVLRAGNSTQGRECKLFKRMDEDSGIGSNFTACMQDGVWELQ